MFEPLILDDDETKNFLDRINPKSWIQVEGVIENADEPFNEGDKFQFIRDGYYAVDKVSRPEQLVFNRITSLKSGK